ncbi:hypothetical protein D3C71_1554930 [compost metagenome]
MILRISSRNSRRASYNSIKSNFLPTVFSASENLDSKMLFKVSGSLARSQPKFWATLITSSTFLLTRTKNATLISARILSLQINPSLCIRAISIFLIEMSMISILWKTGTTYIPLLKATFVPPTPVRTIAFPCGIFL